jgi:hypothetical protein
MPSVDSGVTVETAMLGGNFTRSILKLPRWIGKNSPKPASCNKSSEVFNGIVCLGLERRKHIETITGSPLLVAHIIIPKGNQRDVTQLGIMCGTSKHQFCPGSRAVLETELQPNRSEATRPVLINALIGSLEIQRRGPSSRPRGGAAGPRSGWGGEAVLIVARLKPCP